MKTTVKRIQSPLTRLRPVEHARLVLTGGVFLFICSVVFGVI